MAAFNFPNSPSTNDLHTENSVTWKWNGTVWKRVNNSYLTASTLNVSGIGTFGGVLKIPTVAGTNTNAALNVLFQTATGVIDGGSNLTYNPGGDVLSVNGNHISINTFRGAGDLGTLTCSNHSSTTFVKVSSKVDLGLKDNTAGAFNIKEGSNEYITIDTTNSSELIKFGTAGSEKLRITSGGQVNIGGNYTQTFNTLNVTGNIKSTTRFNVNDAVYLWQQNRMSLGNSFIIESQQSTPFAILTQGVAQPIVFGTNSTERLRIISDGKVSIGGQNASPVGQLEITGNGYHQLTISSNKTANTNKLAGISVLDYVGTGDRVSVFQTYCGSGSNSIYWGSADSSGRGIQNHMIYVNSSSTATTNHKEAVRITSGGNVGIGTVNPQSYDGGAESLVVCGPGNTLGQSGITIVSGSDKYGCLYFARGTGSASYKGRVEYRHDIDVLQMGANGAHGDLVLDSSGNLFLRGDQQIRMVLGSSGSSGYPTDNNSNWIRGNATHLEFNCCTGGYQAWEIGGSQKMKLNGANLELVSASSVRITLGSDGSPGGNDSNWIRGDSNNLMFNCADTSGEHIFEVAGTARAKISPGQGVRAENTCKGWVCYKHDGGVSAIHDDFFVTSVTDEATGTFSIQFDGDMGTEDAIAYQVGTHNQTPMAVGGIAYTPSYGSQNPWWSMEDDWCRINLQLVTASGNTYTDSEWWNLTAHGDAKT